jgi:hypothetical protein
MATMVGRMNATARRTSAIDSARSIVDGVSTTDLALSILGDGQPGALVCLSIVGVELWSRGAGFSVVDAGLWSGGVGLSIDVVTL